MKIIKQRNNITFDSVLSFYDCCSIFIGADKVVLFGTFEYDYTKVMIIDLIKSKTIFDYKIADYSISSRDFSIISSGEKIAYFNGDLEKFFIFDTNNMIINEIKDPLIINSYQENPTIISSQCSKYFLFTSNNDINKKICVYDISLGISIKEIGFPSEVKFDKTITTLENFFSDKFLIFHTPNNRNCYVYNIETLKIEKTFLFPQKYFNMGEGTVSTPISDNKKYFVGTTFRGHEECPLFIVWDLNTTEIVTEIFEDLDFIRNPIYNRAYFSKNSEYLVIDTLDGVLIYETENFTRLAMIKDAFCSEISEDGKYLGYSDGKSYKVFEIEN